MKFPVIGIIESIFCLLWAKKICICSNKWYVVPATVNEKTKRMRGVIGYELNNYACIVRFIGRAFMYFPLQGQMNKTM